MPMRLFKRDVIDGLDRVLVKLEPLRQRWIMDKVSVQPWPRQAFRVPQWQAHRGYWQSDSEGHQPNTIGSLIEAKRRGALMAEFDVRLTRDHIPIVFHDADLGSLDQPELFVKDLTLKEMRQYVGDRYHLATLREVLLSPDVPDILNIEIKSEQVDDALERYICDVIQQTKTENKVMFSSFNPFSIWKVSSYLPQVPRAFLVGTETTHMSLREMWWAPFLKIHMLHLEKVLVNEATMRVWRKLNIPIAVWTMKDQAEIKHFLDLGVASVITDVTPDNLAT